MNTNIENESNNVIYNMILRFSIDFIILCLNKINLFPLN